MGKNVPEPGEPGWKHKDVRGATDPAEVQRILREGERRARELREQVERQRIGRF